MTVKSFEGLFPLGQRSARSRVMPDPAAAGGLPSKWLCRSQFRTGIPRR